MDKESGAMFSGKEVAWMRALAGSMVMISAFIYFATYDLPGSLVKVIEKEFSIDAYTFEYLYTFYGIPSIVVCLLGGMMIDKVFGLYRGLICFSVVSLLGQGVVFLGGFFRVFWIMVAGRFIYGIGTESLIIALNCVIVLWFAGKEMSFVFGMFQSFIRLGTSFAFVFAVPLYDNLMKTSLPKDKVFGVTLLPFFLLVVVQVINVSLLSNFTKKNMGKSQSCSEEVKLSYIIRLPLKLWILLAMFCVSTATSYAFVSCSQEFFEKRYAMSISDANHFSTFYNFFTSVSIPFISVAMNQLGYDLSINLLGIALGFTGQLIMTATIMSPYFPLICFSFSMTIINISTMSLVPWIVDEFQVATAYGVLQSLINAATSAFQILSGYLLIRFGPTGVSLFFTLCLVFSFICSLILTIINAKNKGILNASAKKRKTLQLALR